MDTHINRCQSQGRGIWLYVLLAIATLAAGCATVPEPESAAKADPERAQQAIMNGDKALRSGKLDRAIFEYARTLHFDSNNVEALYKMGTVHSTKGNLDVAETSFRRVLELEPGHTGALEGLGIVLLRERRYKEAKQELLSSMEGDSSRWQAQNGLGVIFDLEGDYSRAEQHYQAALKLKPGSAMVLNNLGYNQYLVGAWQSAEGYFKRVLANDPDHQKAWSNLGLVHVRQGDYPEAIHAFSQIMERPQALNNVGYLCMIDGKRKEAGRFFAEAIRQSPSYYALAHENLAQLQTMDPAGLKPELQETLGHGY